MYLRLFVALVLIAGHCKGAAAQRQAEDPLRQLIENAGSSEDYGGSGTVVVFDSTWVEVDSTGLSHKRSHSLTKILSPAGMTVLVVAMV